MQFKYKYIIIALLSLSSVKVIGQSAAPGPAPEKGRPEAAELHGDPQIARGQIQNGDTLLMMELPEVRVYDRKDFDYLYLKRRYRRLVRNVKKAYPYSQIASKRLGQLEAELAAIESPKEQKAYITKAEKEVMKEFEKDLRRLTVSQGIILVKLIDRETGETSYTLIKELKGSISAFFWQGIARIFGNNLKAEYDPQGEDRIIEHIILGIEAGYI